MPRISSSIPRRSPSASRRFAERVGRENVIAGADCGFASFSTTCEVHPTVVWAKLAALAEGARLATEELWGPGVAPVRSPHPGESEEKEAV